MYHETIYRSLYIQARGALKKELMQHLRQRHKLRRAKCSKQEKRGKIQRIWCLLVNARQKWKIVLFRVIGKVI